MYRVASYETVSAPTLSCSHVRLSRPDVRGISVQVVTVLCVTEERYINSVWWPYWTCAVCEWEDITVLLLHSTSVWKGGGWGQWWWRWRRRGFDYRPQCHVWFWFSPQRPFGGQASCHAMVTVPTGMETQGPEHKLFYPQMVGKLGDFLNGWDSQSTTVSELES